METQLVLNEQLTNSELLVFIAQKLEQLEQIFCQEFILPKKDLSSKEAAKYLGVKLSWLDKLCSANKIRYHKSGKLRYFKISDLDKHKMKYVVNSVDDFDDEVISDYSFERKCGLTTSKRKY